MFNNVDAYKKRVAGIFTTGTVISTGLFAYTQSIALKYVPNGLFNSEAWTVSEQYMWGIDSVLADFTGAGASVVAIFTLGITSYTIIDRIRNPEKYITLAESDGLSKKASSVHDSYHSFDYISLLRQNQDNFKIYFDSVNDKKKVEVVSSIIKLEDIVNPTINQWLVKNYAPIVNKAGIMGVGNKNKQNNNLEMDLNVG